MERLKRCFGILLVVLCIVSSSGVNAQAYDTDAYLKKSMYYHMKEVDDSFKFIYEGDINSALNLVEEASKYGKYTYLNVTSCELYQYGNQFTAKITYRMDKNKHKYVNDKIDQIIKSNITEDMTVYDKVRFVNKYLISNLEYDYNKTSYDPYTALTIGKTVCQGYTMIAAEMYEKLGIENEIAIGKLENEDHGWNRVKIGNHWYNVDTTNCDELRQDELLFLKSDKYLKRFGFSWDENSVTAKADFNYDDISHNAQEENIVKNTKTKVQNSNEWYKLNGKWYYRDLEGNNAVGWLYDNEKWYYLNNDGSMKTGWLNYSGQWYYFNADGSMQTGIKIIDGKIYCFDEIGQWINM